MNKMTLKTILVASLFAGAGINTPTVAQVPPLQPSIGDISILPEGLVTPPDTTVDVMIILDNSMSMRNSLPPEPGDGFALIGGDHPNSRSYEARRVVRDVLAQLEGNINVGGTAGTQYAVNTCGDASPSFIPFDPDHVRTPVIENCATPDAR